LGNLPKKVTLYIKNPRKVTANLFVPNAEPFIQAAEAEMEDTRFHHVTYFSV
jgi:hypothetical protein